MVDFEQLDTQIDDQPDEKYDNLNEEAIENANEIIDNFDTLKDQTIETTKLGNFLRWMNFNPTERNLKEYKEQYDPTHKGIISRRNCLKIVD